ncbi:hypothetical protein [Aquipuribacter sp. SD81]|uniref:hypothetical protein n=1 Tax=Aquipuribacter sp. SD81 TaxID=3127703 RepID=UPI0030197BFA
MNDLLASVALVVASVAVLAALGGPPPAATGPQPSPTALAGAVRRGVLRLDHLTRRSGTGVGGHL